MLECVILVIIGLWLIIAIRSMRKNKNQCNGDCAACQKGQDLCTAYKRDEKKCR